MEAIDYRPPPTYPKPPEVDGAPAVAWWCRLGTMIAVVHTHSPIVAQQLAAHYFTRAGHRPSWVGDVRVRRARRRDLDTWAMWQALGRRS
jgi:hypothetical protein